MTGLNMELVSQAFSADAEPDSVDVILEIEEIDALTLNTDLKVYATIESGSPLTWVEGVLVEQVSDTGSGLSVLRATAIDVSAQTGTNVRYRLTTHNAKLVKIHSIGVLWG